MPKVAVVGANGQVGAELCLLLARHPEIDLIPVCRNRTGSAFLRSCGIPVRHGRVADPQDARRVLSDCDVVVNSSLASGSPREIRRIEGELIRNIFAASPKGASIVHFSTFSVYGDASPWQRIRWRSPYGRTKLSTEGDVRRAASATGKNAFIFRLGHVGGELQGITGQVRKEIRLGAARLPDRDTASNLVFTVTIADAICRVVAGGSTPGTYDLMNSPPWTWREVYEFEADQMGVPFVPKLFAFPSARPPLRPFSGLASTVGALATVPSARNFGAKLFAHAPSAVSSHAMAWWYRRRARTEIAALSAAEAPPPHLTWVQSGHSYLAGLTATRELLAANPYRNLAATGRPRWPADLPDSASAQS